MRDRLTTALELAGLGSVTFGAALLHPAAGWIVGGVLAVAAGALLGAGGRDADGEGRP